MSAKLRFVSVIFNIDLFEILKKRVLTSIPQYCDVELSQGVLEGYVGVEIWPVENRVREAKR